jgi:hypothetical protein
MAADLATGRLTADLPEACCAVEGAAACQRDIAVVCRLLDWRPSGEKVLCSFKRDCTVMFCTDL